jgi:hypothetical protein
MKNHLLALGLGALFATIIACGGSAPSKSVYGGKPTSSRAEIDKLDARITAYLAKLNEPAPASPQPMATVVPYDDSTCPTTKTDTCTETCTLKTSICDAAKRICSIASDLGGADAYANDKCNAGTASCEAAKKRCCNCT